MNKEYLFEIWKDIEGYEGLYQVSNLGRVKALDRYVKHWRGGLLLRKEQIKRQSNDCDGYLIVTLCKEGKIKNYRVHRLVAEAFIPNPNNYPQVNHKDENKQNNFVWVNEDGTVDLEKSNLEWCTNKYNVTYGTGIKRRSTKRINCKVLSKQIAQYSLEGELIKIWPSAMEVKRQLGYSNSVICNCCAGRNKTSYGYKWKKV